MNSPQMQTWTRGRRAVAGLVLATIGTTAHAQATLAEAMERYERGHWSAAFADLSALANHSDAEAARIAVLMVRHGPALYKTRFAAAPGQVENWVRLASRQDTVVRTSGATP